MKALTLSLALATGLLFQAGPATADTLLVQRAQSEQGGMPARGQRMAQVEASFGAPQHKHAPVAGPNNHKDNPPITRWVYPNFTVYFENDHVVDAVANRASPNEVGPKPVQ